MNIEFTNEQFRDLLFDVAFAGYIRASVCEEGDEDCANKMLGFEKYLAAYADKFGASDMVEKGEDGELTVSEDILNDMGEILQEFLEDRFWEGLMTRMAERDMLRTMSPEAFEKLIEKSEVPPKELADIVDKYSKEFEKHGVDRLEIKR